MYTFSFEVLGPCSSVEGLSKDQSGSENGEGLYRIGMGISLVPLYGESDMMCLELVEWESEV